MGHTARHREALSPHSPTITTLILANVDGSGVDTRQVANRVACCAAFNPLRARGALRGAQGARL